MVFVACTGCDRVAVDPQVPPEVPSRAAASQQVPDRLPEPTAEPTAEPTPEPPLAAEPARPSLPEPSAALESDPRRVRYLEMGVEQTLRLEKAIGQIGATRQSTGAVAAAALSHVSGRQPNRRVLVARWSEQALARCGGRWSTAECERGRLRLQRLVLSYPEELPETLLDRLRTAVGSAPPPPAPGGSAWDFRQTENQRIVTIASALAGLAVVGRGDSPSAAGWAVEAKEFLRAHDLDGWYEADSPGYLAISIDALLMLADFAADRRVRDMANRQLNLLFGAWAQEQVRGFPAGAKTRTYVHWASSTDNTPWAAWYWLITGQGEPSSLKFLDAPDLALSGYRVPKAVASLAAERRKQPPYEIYKRRKISPAGRRKVDAAIHSYATPDYILSVSQAVDGLRLGVSGGQEIVASLMPEAAAFAPLYLWSRTSHDRSTRWQSWSESDLAAGEDHIVLAKLNAEARGVGHVFFAPAWERPQVEGVRCFARLGSTYVALHALGGWQVSKAAERFPEFYGGDRSLRQAWVAVARQQPARIAMEVGRAADYGAFEAFVDAAARSELSAAGDDLRFVDGSGRVWVYRPGQSLTVDSSAVDARAYPLLRAPFLRRDEVEGWRFQFGTTDYRFRRLR